MKIGGTIDISTKDIPGKVAIVIFTVGCNFHCGFCHNKYLLQLDVGKNTSIREIISTIKSNLLVSAVSITGGEPTLQKGLVDLCKEIKQIGKYLSIDTNGSHPEVISEIIHYVDRIALDLKAPLKAKKLKLITGENIDPNLIKATINFINKYQNIEFEIRTTYIKNLLTPYDIHEIIKYLSEIAFRGNYVLQQYQYSDGVGEEFKEQFVPTTHNDLLQILKSYKESELPFKLYLRDDVVGYSNIFDVFSMKLEDL
ncbi:MAG: anaerobic ribonucleoside-triphosphate reductase activating protein [Promethearchaeota archaeon]